MNTPLHALRFSSQRWFNWLLIGAVLTIVILAGVAVQSLIDKVDTARQMEVAIARLEHKAHELAALEWETLHKGRMTDELAEKEKLSCKEMAQQFGVIERLDLKLPQIVEVKKCYDRYLFLVKQEFVLLASGAIPQAEQLDEAEVDPAFEELSNSLTAADQAFDELAHDALRQVRVWIYVVSLAATMAISLLFWRFYQKQHVAAVATAAQGVLCEANEQLRIEITRRTEAQQKLEEMQGELIKASRHAGMQEVATGVLHNVGNVLNSINVTASLLRERMRKSQVQNLIKGTNLLRDHAADTADFLTCDPKGRRLPGYLIKVGDHLVSEQLSWQEELDDLGKNIEHIKEIVTMQQSYARLSGVTENLKVEELVEDALRLNEGALGRHAVRVVRAFQAVPLVSVDRHKVLQILINLIRNAKHAANDSGRSDKEIAVTIRCADPAAVFIEVQDNGIGIPPENLARIFQHGFTTKKDGHGFGLHSSVNAAREMAGNLTVHSDGPGLGATFKLELPAAKTAELTII